MIKEFFEQEMNIINTSYEKFSGNGLYIGLFLLAIIYVLLNLKKEQKNTKNLLLIYPILVCLIIWNPFFVDIIIKFISADVYWRMFWLLPIGILISYALTKIIYSISQRNKRVISMIVIVVIVFLGGKFIYTEEFFTKVDNYLKVPDEVLDIIFVISADNEEYKKVAGPEEFLVYTRQVDGTILVQTYRNVLGEYASDSMLVKMAEGDINAICNKAKESECNYVVLKKDTVLNGNMEEYEFEKLYENNLYILYKY